MEGDLATSDIVATNGPVDASPPVIRSEPGVRPTAPIETVTRDRGMHSRRARSDASRQLCTLGESRRFPRLRHSPDLSGDTGPI